QAGQRAHLLDDLDLLVASGLQDDVELVLLLDLVGGGGTAALRGLDNGRGRGGRLDVEGLLEGLHELRKLKEGHLLERVEQVSAAELRHDKSPCYFVSPGCLPRSPPRCQLPRCSRHRRRPPRPSRAARRRAAPSASAAR